MGNVIRVDFVARKVIEAEEAPDHDATADGAPVGGVASPYHAAIQDYLRESMSSALAPLPPDQDTVQLPPPPDDLGTADHPPSETDFALQRIRIYQLLSQAARAESKNSETAALSFNWRPWHYLAAAVLDGWDIYSTRNPHTVQAIITHAANVAHGDPKFADWQECYIQSLESRLRVELRRLGRYDILPPSPDTPIKPQETAARAKKLRDFLRLQLNKGWK